MNILKMGQKGIAHFVMPLVVIVGIGVIGTAVYALSHADTSCRATTYQKGDSGTCVVYIQKMLNGDYRYWAGDYPKVAPAAATVPPNGSFGADTANQVLRWVKISNSIPGNGNIPVTSVVDAVTWSKLCYFDVQMNTNPELTSWMVTAIDAAHDAGCNVPNYS